MASKWLKPPTIVSTTSWSFSPSHDGYLALFLFTPLLLPSSNHRLDASSLPVSMPSSLRVLAKESHAFWKPHGEAQSQPRGEKGEGSAGRRDIIYFFFTQQLKIIQNIFQPSTKFCYCTQSQGTSCLLNVLFFSLSIPICLFLSLSHTSSHLLNTRPVCWAPLM